jgi:hypothetical protein
MKRNLSLKFNFSFNNRDKSRFRVKNNNYKNKEEIGLEEEKFNKYLKKMNYLFGSPDPFMSLYRMNGAVN